MLLQNSASSVVLPLYRTSSAQSIELRSGPYLLKIAENEKDLEGVIRLRSRVFREDFGALVATYDPLWDFDALDLKADHLIVIDERTKETVGSYRLLSDSRGPTPFYSASEFDLSGFLATRARKLELSRACVDSRYREGLVVILLWKGLTEYIKRTGAEVLFGCSSLNTENPEDVTLVLDALLAENCIETRFGIKALPEYRMAGISEVCGVEPSVDVPKLPPLLRMYLKAGAKIARDPAHDRAFRCVDLLTILDLSEITESVARKFGLR